ncbi:unnamed protein product [Larinioides sclopetarius]|uniref:Uncharacterized protein n=1 Tax=Larinioides sclopetarius TaxID=280406 RepID=A0AAV2BUJ1_9ARAC
MKFLFSKHGGFQRLIKFICSSRLIRGKCNKNDRGSRDDFTAAAQETDIPEEIKKELGRAFWKIPNPEEIANDQKSLYLANLVLLIPSIVLPSLPSYTDLIKRLVEYRKNIALKKAGEGVKTETIEKFEALNVGLHERLSSIPDSKYANWNGNVPNSIDESDPVRIELDSSKNKVEQLNSHPVSLKQPNDIKATMEANALSFAQDVLSTKSDELPTLPAQSDLIARLDASSKKEVTKTSGKDETALTSEISNVASHGSSSSSFDSKNNSDPTHQKNIEPYENIIQAVIRYNHSKSSSNVNANKRIQKATDNVLEHCKDKIESLIEVLDKW